LKELSARAEQKICLLLFTESNNKIISFFSNLGLGLKKANFITTSKKAGPNLAFLYKSFTLIFPVK